jgi:nicotinate-nucleotide adenylyltransferase
LAIAGEHGFALSLADRPRATAGDEQAPNYTIDTLARLRAELAAGSELFCLMGADAFFGLRLWHRAAALPFVAQLIVAARPGQPLDDLRAALPNELTFVEAPPAANNAPLRTFVLTNPAGEQTRMYVLPDLEIPVSATDIREQLSAAPNALAALAAPLPESVAEYIRAHGLYR